MKKRKVLKHWNSEAKMRMISKKNGLYIYSFIYIYIYKIFIKYLLYIINIYNTYIIIILVSLVLLRIYHKVLLHVNIYKT